MGAAQWRIYQGAAMQSCYLAIPVAQLFQRGLFDGGLH